MSTNRINHPLRIANELTDMVSKGGPYPHDIEKIQKMVADIERLAFNRGKSKAMKSFVNAVMELDTMVADASQDAKAEVIRDLLSMKHEAILEKEARVPDAMMKVFTILNVDLSVPLNNSRPLQYVKILDIIKYAREHGIELE